MSNESMGWRREKRSEAAGPSSSSDGDTPALNLTRRVFLRNGSLTVAAAGLLSAAPGLPGLLSGVTSEAPAADTTALEASEFAAGPLAESLVVQVRDLQTGEMSVYLGEREIVYRDPGLASKILRSAR